MKSVKERIRRSTTLYSKASDRGDFVGIKGTTFLTKVGEPSVKVKEQQYYLNLFVHFQQLKLTKTEMFMMPFLILA